MTILLRITDPMAELFRLYDAADVRTTTTQREAAYKRGVLEGLSQSIQTLDMSQQYMDTGIAQPVRAIGEIRADWERAHA